MKESEVDGGAESVSTDSIKKLTTSIFSLVLALSVNQAERNDT